MDDYNAATITSAYQNLKIEQDNTKETNDDITNIFIIFMFNNIEINFNIISRKIFIN